ncbi:MAG: hypothetical protein HQ519_17895 [Planctomycetes bacterium]|nr:hypothetical protein [Planctomycetota bacterium]
MRHSIPLFTFISAALLAGMANAHVEITSPNGGESLQGQQSFLIEWHDTINHGSGVDYEIEFSADGGTTWAQVVEGLPYSGGVSAYTWIVPNENTSQGQIRVTMHVSQTITYNDKSDGDFNVTSSYNSYGNGTALNGITPKLDVRNVPKAGGEIIIHVSKAQASVAAHIFAGSAPRNFPLFGVTILNNADLRHAIVTVDNNGEIILPFTLPTATIGMNVYLQVAIESTPTTSATAGVHFVILP